MKKELSLVFLALANGAGPATMTSSKTQGVK